MGLNKCWYCLILYKIIISSAWYRIKGSNVERRRVCASQNSDKQHFSKSPSHMKDPSMSARGLRVLEGLFPSPSSTFFLGLLLMLFSQSFPPETSCMQNTPVLTSFIGGRRKKRGREREREKVGGLHNRQQTPWQYSCYMLIQTPWASVRTVRGTAAALRSLLNKMCKHTLALFNKEHHYLAQNICWHHHG